MATFETQAGGDRYECSLIALPGDGGGLIPNARRWAGQLGLAVPPDRWEAWTARIEERRTSAGHELRIMDFRTLQPEDDPAAISMLGAVVRRPNDSLFLKFMAPRAVLDERSATFAALAATLE